MQLVDHALVPPNGCMICGADGNPNNQILDLLHEFSPMHLRLYLCRNHGREVAKALGYEAGEEQESLMTVRGELVALQRQHEKVQTEFEELRADMKMLLGAYKEKEADLEREAQRSVQLQQQLDEVRRATTATLNATAPTLEDDLEPALD
jgi:hypothetical protein